MLSGSSRSAAYGFIIAAAIVYNIFAARNVDNSVAAAVLTLEKLKGQHYKR
jgi:hypothetical protein